MNTTYVLGIKKLKEVDGSAGEDVLKTLEDIAPDLSRYIIEFAFGEIYQRKELSLQEREIITITSLLTTGGCEDQLKIHVNGSLNVGILPEKIVEVFIQCVPYVGFPKVLNAIKVTKTVFQERGICISRAEV